MGKIVLHVGMPKTGTSFVQGILNRNKTTIERDCNLKLLNGLTPHIIASFLIEDSVLSERSDIASLKKSYDESTYNEVRHSSELAKTVVLSSEYFVLANKERIISYFARYFSDIEIIVTVRRQDKLLASGYNQDVKALARTTNLSWNPSDAPYLDYWLFCEEWSKLGVKVHVIDYDLAKEQKNGLLTSFFQTLDIDYIKLETSILPPGNDASNYSLSYSEVLFKLALNRMGLANSNNIFQDFINTDKLKLPFELPKALENRVMSYYEQNNKKLVDKYLNSESKLLCPEINKVNTSPFNWDPLDKIESIFTFLMKNCSK